MSDKFVAQDIQKLKFPDNIRKRFNLYGGSNEDSTILFRELVDNGIDLVLKNRISLTVTAFTDRSYHIVGWRRCWAPGGHRVPAHHQRDRWHLARHLRYLRQAAGDH